MSFIIRRSNVIDLLQGLDHAVLLVEPLHVRDERRIVHLRFARENDAGADRLRLRLAARQDLQMRIYRVRESCKTRKPQTVIKPTGETAEHMCMCVCLRVQQA